MAESSKINDSDYDNPPKWQIARETLKMFVNNKENEAFELFQKHPDDIHMYAGYFTTKVIDALMTLEEDKLVSALAILKEAEKKCGRENNNWLSIMKSKASVPDSSNAAYQLETQIILADSYLLTAALTFMQQDLSGYFKGGWVLRKAWKQYQGVYAEISKLNELVEKNNKKDDAESQIDKQGENSQTDQVKQSNKNANGYNDSASYAHHTINSTFLPKQSTSFHESLHSFIKKHDKSDTELINDENDDSKSTTTAGSSLCSSRSESPLNNYLPYMRKSNSVNSALSKHFNRNKRISNRFTLFGSNISLSYFTSTFNLFSTDKYCSNYIDDDTIKRLMGAVSFGYGLLQLGISLLPTALIRITNILGFHGNRQEGLSNLMLARLSNDMRAPLAILALLWYHTIVRPFYALDGSNVQAGVAMASQLIEETGDDYQHSALFQFFRGRVHRLNSNIEQALIEFQSAVDNTNQREIKLLSVHEIGWCQIIQLYFEEAQNTFFKLKSSSRWSRPFYTYLSTTCAGACGADTKTAIAEFTTAMKSMSKGTQLDVFLGRRYNICTKDDLSEDRNPLFYKILVYELLYLWNTLPSCNNENIDKIMEDCGLADETENDPMLGLAKLIEGCCHCIRNNIEQATEILRCVIEKRKELPNNASDSHISAFACYELGLLLVKNPETKAEGVSLFEKALLYKGYDFEERLEVRLNSLIKRYRETQKSL